MENLIVKASIQIQKKPAAVFEAIVNPEKMSNYFIASSTGKLEDGKTVTWRFPEFPDEFPVTGMAIKENELVTFDWSGGAENMKVEIRLEAFGENGTVVRVAEYEKPADATGIKWAMQQSEGWANFLASMKAYLEYGINLRKGAFSFMKS